MSFDIVFRGVDKVSGVSKSIAKNVKDDQDKIKSSTRKANENLDQQRIKVEGIAHKFGVLRNKILVYSFASAGLVGVLKNVAKETSNLEESTNAVNVVFGKGAVDIFQFGENVARSVGLARSEFNQLATQTGALLKDTGLTESQVAKQTIQLTERAADLASVFNTDVKDALSAINQAVRGETEAIRRYAGDVTDATLQTYLLSKGINANVTSMSQHEKRLQRVNLILEQTDVASGDFQNTSETLANQLRILDSNVRNLAASIGGPLVSALASATSEANEFVETTTDENFIKALDNTFIKLARYSIPDLINGYIWLSNYTLQAERATVDYIDKLLGVEKVTKRIKDNQSFAPPGTPASSLGFESAQQNILAKIESARNEENKKAQDIAIRNLSYIITQEDMLVARGLEFNEVTNNTNEVLIEVAKQLGIAGINAEYLSTLWKVSGEVEVPNILEEMNNVTKSTIDWGSASESVASQLARAYSEGKKVSKELRLGFGIAATLLRLIPATGLLGGLLGSASSFLGSFQSGVDMSFNTGATSSQGRMYAFRAHDDESVRLQVGRPGSTVNNTTNDSSIGTIVVNNYGGELSPEKVAIAVREARNKRYLS